MARLLLFLIFSSFLNFHFWGRDGWQEKEFSRELAPVREVLTAGADLSGSYLSASQCTLAPLDELTYTLRLYNSGDLAATASITDQLPGELTLVQDSLTAGGLYDEGTGQISWKDVTVPAGAGISLSYTVQAALVVDHLTIVANRAIIQVEGQQFDRKVSIALVPETAPQLIGSYQTASQTSLAPGEQLIYTIHLYNNGVGTAVLNVADPVPPALNYIPGSASSGVAYDSSQATLSWKDISVPPGEERDLTFQVEAAEPVNQELPVINTASISSGSLTLYRKIGITLLPEPPVEEQDVQPPLVEKVIIGEADVLLDRQTNLRILAQDDTGVESMYIREWILSSKGLPHWEFVQSSGWVDYNESFAWTLSPAAGVHFIGVWVADRAGNQSSLDHKGVDSASLFLAETQVAEKGYVTYLVYYPAGVEVTATLNPVSGDPDLYAWGPGNPLGPNAKSTRREGTETLRFKTARDGTYLFLVHGYTAAAFDLSLSPSGGPEGWSWRGEAMVPNPSPDTLVKLDELTMEPVLSQSGLDPLGGDTTQAPGGSRLRMFLPLLFHR